MRLIKHQLFFLSVLFSVSIYCQTTLLGKITNNKGEPVENTAIFFGFS